MELVPRENIYGHRQRLYWLRDHLQKEDRAVEFGCGTGRLITIPLRAWGYEVTGVDLDETSIAHGREVLERDRKSTRLNSSHVQPSRMPSSA